MGYTEKSNQSSAIPVRNPRSHHSFYLKPSARLLLGSPEPQSVSDVHQPEGQCGWRCAAFKYIYICKHIRPYNQLMIALIFITMLLNNVYYNLYIIYKYTYILYIISCVYIYISLYIIYILMFSDDIATQGRLRISDIPPQLMNGTKSNLRLGRKSRTENWAPSSHGHKTLDLHGFYGWSLFQTNQRKNSTQLHRISGIGVLYDAKRVPYYTYVYIYITPYIFIYAFIRSFIHSFIYLFTHT